MPLPQLSLTNFPADRHNSFALSFSHFWPTTYTSASGLIIPPPTRLATNTESVLANTLKGQKHKMPTAEQDSDVCVATTI